MQPYCAGIGPDAVPRIPAGTAVALGWPAEEERLFDHDDRAMPAVPAAPEVQKETDHV
jgi:hypothetical protein